ncbi:indole-3-glycerol phosphate synthase TrpC [Hyphobacterium marinum]|uniref:Indole-3-glycerol phosphate synthase n=1 Tax=Hyphobacterium marinum TaxID=3116574 RepID=A0ABU7M136_9PROT|nr:indole-3-glycerol phosphate synthase TrpC [Hyphobacterium sp. Y6023]MEE2567519.1 indole-3-glycerol phosphate synthase TrpC [Hyphobacterium sp. Y6023]
MNALQKIEAYKREEIVARKAARPLAQMSEDAREASAPRGFLKALKARAALDGIALIAEVKKASPSKGLIRADFDPAALARAYEIGGAACLSVLTDAPGFQGHEDYLVAARAACALPVLRKDFMLDPWQIVESRALGADAILVILASVDDALAADLISTAWGWGMDALVETHNEAEVERALTLNANLIGVNNRDLTTFETSLATFERLAPRFAGQRFAVAESGIATPEDVTRVREAGARAVLVGESLMRQGDVAKATRTLMGTAAFT